MNHTTQVEVTKRILEHIDKKSTDMVSHIDYNNVSAYTSEDQYAQEKKLLFHEYPIVVGLSCQIPEPGDFFTADFTGIPILVTRNRKGAAKAYLNVCRHRGAKVEFEDSGCGRKVFSCPYHAWSYDLDGKVVGIPNTEGFKGLDRAGYGLRELPIEEKYGLIWVCHKLGNSFDIDELLGAELAQELDSYNLAAWHHFETRLLERPLNWKGVVDGFLEIYHVGKLHKKTIAPIFFDDLSLFDPFNRNHRMVIARKTIEQVRADPSATEDLLVHLGVVYMLFPNTVVVRQGEHIEVWQIYPGKTVDQSVVKISLATTTEPLTDSAKRHWANNFQLLLDTVIEEDMPVAISAQAGYNSGAQEFVTFGRNEPAMGHYHRNIREFLGQPSIIAQAAAR